MIKNMVKNKFETLQTIEINELIEYDSSLTIAKSLRKNFSLDQLGIAYEPKSYALHFIKSESLWKNFQEKCQTYDVSEVLVIVDKKLESVAANHPRISTCLVSTNVELSMAKISHLLYKKKFSSFNWLLDGRTAANTIIHPTALVSPLAFIGENVVIHENVVVHPGAHISAFCEIECLS